jgi:Fe-S cluster assembly ATPase SufC
MKIRSLLLATLMLVFVVNANSQKEVSKKGKSAAKKELTGGFVLTGKILRTGRSLKVITDTGRLSMGLLIMMQKAKLRGIKASGV